MPGYLLWVAMLFAGLGAAIPALLGRRLERATTLRQAMEAEYREALVRARDAGGIAGPHAPRLRGLFGAVAGAFREQTAASAILQLFCAASARLGQGIPYLVATPAWLAGVVTLGWVMQAAQAFTCVAAALSWPVDHMPRIATWRASAERVLAMDAGQAPLPLPAPMHGPIRGPMQVNGSRGGAGGLGKRPRHPHLPAQAAASRPPRPDDEHPMDTLPALAPTDRCDRSGPAPDLRHHRPPGCRQDHADGEAAAEGRRHPAGRRRARQGQCPPHPVRLDEDRAGPRHLGRHLAS